MSDTRRHTTRVDEPPADMPSTSGCPIHALWRTLAAWCEASWWLHAFRLPRLRAAAAVRVRGIPRLPDGGDRRRGAVGPHLHVHVPQARLMALQGSARRLKLHRGLREGDVSPRGVLALRPDAGPPRRLGAGKNAGHGDWGERVTRRLPARIDR